MKWGLKVMVCMLPLILWMVTANAYVSSVNYQNQQFNQRYNSSQFNNRVNNFNNRQTRRSYRYGYHPYSHGYRYPAYRGYHQYRHVPRTYPNRVYRGGAPGGFRH